MCLRASRKSLVPALVALMLLLSFQAVWAKAKIPTPTNLPGGELVTVEDSQGLVEQKGTIFFDTRSALNYGKGHLPGAVALPYFEKSAKAVDFDPAGDHVDLSLLPADKNTTLVFYSHGETGWKSYKAAVLAIRAGYTDVRWFRSGFSSWLEKGLAAEF